MFERDELRVVFIWKDFPIQEGKTIFDKGRMVTLFYYCRTSEHAAIYTYHIKLIFSSLSTLLLLLLFFSAVESLSKQLTRTHIFVACCRFFNKYVHITIRILIDLKRGKREHYSGSDVSYGF